MILPGMSESITKIEENAEAKRKAIAFLFTTGAKALILADIMPVSDPDDLSNSLELNDCFNSSSSIQTTSSGVARSNLLDGVLEEYKERVRMDRESNKRSMLILLHSKLGINIIKCSRKGNTRSIKLRVKKKSSGDILCWKSKLNRWKTFSLVDVIIESISTQRENMSNVADSGSTDVFAEEVSPQAIENPADDLSVRFQAADSWIRLRNASRSLELWFSSPSEVTAFKDWLWKEYIDNRARQTTVLAHQEEVVLD